MLDPSLALRLDSDRGLPRVRIAHKKFFIKQERGRNTQDARALFLSNTAEERVELLWDRLDLSGWEERIRKSKRQPKLPGRHQETVRFFNAVKKRERERSDDNDALEGARAVG